MSYKLQQLEISDSILNHFLGKPNEYSPNFTKTHNKGENKITISKYDSFNQFTLEVYNRLLVIKNRDYDEQHGPGSHSPMISFYKADGYVDKNDLICIYATNSCIRKIILTHKEDSVFCKLSDCEYDYYMRIERDGNSPVTFNSALQEAIHGWIEKDRQSSFKEFCLSLNRAKYSYTTVIPKKAIIALDSLERLFTKRRQKISN